MSPPVIAKLNKTLIEIITNEKIRARLVAVGVIVRGSTAQDFGQLIANEYKHWDPFREAAGIVRQ
jgi:tripartite-type tricarboxylate transporter receptor subunit TctC